MVPAAETALRFKARRTEAFNPPTFAPAVYLLNKLVFTLPVNINLL